ncbi:MAG: hypothetical protein IAI50_11970 [Candidatus Eremiobacteraeota bacterium]|nr:hypothetical protein [Candidatus Eremiobacteraeota bacterium]
MRPFHGTPFVAGGCTLALLTGCSGGGNIAGPAVGDFSSGPAALRSTVLRGMPTSGTRVAVHPFINFAAMAKNKSNTIAISDQQNSLVELFTAAGVQIGQLTGFEQPAGMASDIKGNLYVADKGNSRVQIYAAGFASPPTTLQDPGQYPLDVDSFANGAYIAVANVATTAGGAGSVSIFKGSTLLSNVSVPNNQNVFFCAFDASGNLYVDGLDTNESPIIGEIPNATSGGSTFVPLTTTNSIGYATSIQVTTSGQIAIEDGDNNAIYTYNPPTNGSLGAPMQTTPIGITTYTFAFTKNMADLYSADEIGTAFEFAYPAGGGSVSAFFVGGIPYGTAVIPSQYPKKSSS